MGYTEQEIIKDIVSVVQVTGISYKELREISLSEYHIIRAEAVKMSRENATK